MSQNTINVKTIYYFKISRKPKLTFNFTDNSIRVARSWTSFMFVLATSAAAADASAIAS